MGMSKRLFSDAVALIFVLAAATVRADTIGLTPISGGFNNTGKMVNDSVLNVTWADVAPSILVNWAGAHAWIDGLNAGYYGGYNDWRLATANGVVNEHDCGSNSPNELGCLFYNELGNSYPVGVTNLGPFTNISNPIPHGAYEDDLSYWSGTELAGAVYFYGAEAAERNCCNNDRYKALAVRTGQTLDAPPPVTPIPATVWLLISSIGGLGMFARRRNA